MIVNRYYTHPTRNKRNLMLRPDVIESVRRGRFHVYAVDTVDQAVESLMTRPFRAEV